MEDETIYDAIIMREDDLASSLLLPPQRETYAPLALHLKEPPNKCNICNIVVTRQYMKHHINKHTGARPYLCLECGKDFNDKPNFSRHMNIHYGTKVYQCPTCPYKPNQSSNLKTHIKKCKGR